MANFDDLLDDEVLMKEFMQTVVNTPDISYGVMHNKVQYNVKYSIDNGFIVRPQDICVSGEVSESMQRLLNERLQSW